MQEAVWPLGSWEVFYLIVGSSAAALIGLQFVVVVLGADLNRMIEPRILFSFLTTSTDDASLKRLACADEHSIPLIVEIGALVDELKVGNGKFRLAPLSTVPLRFNLVYPR